MEHFGATTTMNTNSHFTATTANSLGETAVSGTLGWIDDGNVWHPMQYNTVEIWDDRYDEKLGTVYTDAVGVYEFSFEDECTYRNIYVKIFAGGRNALVIDETEKEYIYTSTKRMNIIPGTTISIDWNIDMSGKLGQAFQISQAVNVATEYVKAMNGEYLPLIKVKYPHTNDDHDGFYYDNGVINIKERDPAVGYPETYASWDVIMHEYGHHIQVKFNITDSPGGNHPITHNLTERYVKDIGVRLAWGEAYPSVFGAMAQEYYASTLQNIDTVGDTRYTSYTGADLDYEVMERKGEACEASIIGVFWDLFDGLNESYDTISLSHSNYWDMITDMGEVAQNENEKVGTMSAFCNYFVQKYDTEKVYALGKLLSFYKIAPSNTMALVDGETPLFSWDANGNTYLPDQQPRYPNDHFSLVFYDMRGDEVLRIDDIGTTSYTLADEEWQTVMCGYGQQYTVIVVGYQIYDHKDGEYSSPATGGYYSAPLQIAKPIENQSSSIVQNSPGNMRYFEKTMTITPGTYYDLHVTFMNAGTKLIQTFSSEYTALELYSESGDLLVGRDETIDNGYGNNAFFSFDVAANTKYIIRVKMWDYLASGSVKVAMIPAKGECVSEATSIQRFEDIITFGDCIFHTASLEYNYANVLVFKPLESGEYVFEISSNMDTFISIIDPRSPNALTYNVDYADNGGMGQNAALTKTLEANVPYVVVYSGYDIWDTNNTGGLLLNAYPV